MELLDQKVSRRQILVVECGQYSPRGSRAKEVAVIKGGGKGGAREKRTTCCVHEGVCDGWSG